MPRLAAALIPTAWPLPARAVLVGLRIDTRGLERWPHHRLGVIERPGGWVFVFPFGAVVLVGVGPDEEPDVLAELAPRVRGALEVREREEIEVVGDPSTTRTLDAAGRVVLREVSDEQLAAVASVLAKSVLLAHYEARSQGAMERVERLAERLAERGGKGVRSDELLREVGDVLLAQSRIVGRAEVGEKLELTWDLPEVERVYERLAAEYELVGREAALERKLALIDRTTTIYLDLIRARQSHRVEWYIVGLIAFEIALSLFGLASSG